MYHIPAVESIALKDSKFNLINRKYKMCPLPQVIKEYCAYLGLLVVISRDCPTIIGPKPFHIIAGFSERDATFINNTDPLHCSQFQNKLNIVKKGNLF